MTTAAFPTQLSRAEQIPTVTADEAYQLLKVSFDRFIRLIEALSPEEWRKPTPCTEWNVRDMVAHQAGSYATGLGYGELFRQYLTPPKPGQLPEDAINARQLAERAHKTPADLLAELKQIGEQSVHKLVYGFNLVRWVAIPHPVTGILSLDYIFWIIHSRDTWIHRLDICIATGRPFELTREHDGRIVALVVRDAAKKMAAKLGGKSIALTLTGVAGGSWQIGPGQPAATLEMDAVDFNLYLSGRANLAEVLRKAHITGEKALVEHALKGTQVLY